MLMKIIAIGDIHGRDSWKKIVEKYLNEVDKIIFIGDYFDSFNIPFIIQKSNFLEIMELKNKYPDKVITLMGNHDFHYYINSIKEIYSGYQPQYSLDIYSILDVNVRNGNLQVCVLFENTLFSHAGISSTWLENNNILCDQNMVNDINDHLIYKPSIFKFTPGKNFSKTGNDVTQGPLWIRPESLINKNTIPYTQVVGHTRMNDITFLDGDNSSYFFIDVLDTGIKCLMIDPSIKKVTTELDKFECIEIL